MEDISKGANIFFVYDGSDSPCVVEYIEYWLAFDLNRVVDQFFKSAFVTFGAKVLSGVFAGMDIGKNFAWSDGNVVIKLLGVYEIELQNTIQKAISRRPKTIVNIGCAEGYYTVGLGRLLPEARIMGCDIDPEALKIATTNAKKNNLNNVTFWLVDGEYYNFYDIAELMYSADLAIIDCEAGECAYLHEVLQPLFGKLDIIVECHDFLHAGVSDDLIARFQKTHSIEVIKPAQLSPPYSIKDFDVLGQTMPEIVTRDFHPKEKFLWLAMWSKERDQALSA